MRPFARNVFCRGLVFGLLLTAASPGSLRAQPIRQPPRHGPWDLDLVLLESEDGIRFTRRGPFVERAGVPTLVADRNGELIALFQWFPEGRPEAFDRVAASRSKDGGKTWTPPEPIAVEGFPSDLRRPFDPTLVELEDGRFRLYFTSHPGADRDGPEFEGERRPGIYSAVSKDAMHYQFEPEVRFRVEGEPVIDCAVGRLGDGWHLFAPVQGRQGAAYHAVSKEGLQFERQADVTLDVRGSWLGCAVPVENGLRFYGTGRGGWSAFSSDGKTWRLDREAAWSLGADPGVARTRGGKYLMAATGELRPNAGAGRPGERPGEPPGGRPGEQPGGPDDGPAGPLGPARQDARRRPPYEPPVMTANADHVYILRGGMLHQFDARTLKLKKSVPLAEDPQRDPEEKPGDGRRQEKVPREKREPREKLE